MIFIFYFIAAKNPICFLTKKKIPSNKIKSFDSVHAFLNIINIMP